jgi:choline kinase
MKAILLAAGIGRRLGDIPGGSPKCLLEFNGVSLLSRHVHNLEQLGISGLVVVTGHRMEIIEQALAVLKTRLPVTTVYNPDFLEGSVISMYRGGANIGREDTVLLMDADVLYGPDVLRRLLESPHANCFLLDREFIPGDEPVKLCVTDGKLVEFSKQPAPDVCYDYLGESVGFFKFSGAVFTELLQRARDYLDRGRRDQPYEEVIRDSLLEYPDRYSFEDITGMPWLEIDFPEDVRRAEEEVLPRIDGNEK